jgi:hypothetical protein
LVEQQKIDIAEESTTTAKKETKQQLENKKEAQEQDNAAGIEAKNLKE